MNQLWPWHTVHGNLSLLSHLDGRSHIRQSRTCSRLFFKISLGHLKAGNRTGHLLSLEPLRFVLSSSAQIAAVILPALDRLPAQATCRSWGAIPEFKRHNAGPMGYMAGMGFWVFPQYYCSILFMLVSNCLSIGYWAIHDNTQTTSQHGRTNLIHNIRAWRTTARTMHCIHPCRLREYPTSGCMGAMGAKGNIISEPNAGSVLDGIVWCIRLKN